MVRRAGSSSPRRKTTAYRSAAEGFAKGREEVARNKEAAERRKSGVYEPFRFYMKPGETKEFIIVDDEPTFFRYEHNLKDPKTGRYSIHTGCVKEADNCPICESDGKESYYAMYLTVIDLTEFEDRKGKTHEFSRKLLVVKAGQQAKFQRFLAKADKQGRTLRGALIEASRDGDRDPQIGNDLDLVEWLDEEELEGYVTSFKDKEGNKKEEVCHDPYDYEKIFPDQDVEELRAMVGGRPTPGSRAEEREALGRRSSRRGGRDADDEEDEDDDDWDSADRTERMSTTKKRKAVDKDEEEEPPRRASRRGAKKDEPPWEDDEEEEDEEEEEGEEERSRRPARKTKAAKPAPTRTRRRVQEDEEEEDEEEEVPNRRNPRRVSLRKGRG